MTAVDTAVEEPAPAKINLALHVTGRRADGYRLLDSLVAFADARDVIRAEPADDVSLAITGPMAEGAPGGAGNSVLRAAALIGVSRRDHARKNCLPASAGIGGGSSDAAACLRALARLGSVPVPGPRRGAGAGRGRAGLPAGTGRRGCAGSARMWRRWQACRGSTPCSSTRACRWPRPRCSRGSSGATLQRCRRRCPRWLDASDCARWLAKQRNDLEAPARALCPEIGTVLDRLRATGSCTLARMSGSGATCFGLYPDSDMAGRAAARIAAERPDWWVRATRLR